MAVIDPTQLLSQMVEAFLGELGQGAGDVRRQVEDGLSTVASVSKTIAERFATGEIDQNRAAIQFRVAQRTAEITLLTALGIALVVLEKALNAAIDVARQAIQMAADLVL